MMTGSVAFPSACGAVALWCLLGWHGSAAGEVKVIDPLIPVRTKADVDQAAARQVLRLVGPRNGFCSAVAVVTGDARATISDLTGPGGTVRRSDIQIRYAAKDPHHKPPKVIDRPWMPEAHRYVAYCDTLFEAPPADADVIPVWVTVHIPGDLESGVYTGTLAVDGRKVPVRLEVAPWRCPSPADWTAEMFMVTSPESLARHYKLELWSKAHLALVERELHFAAGLGNRMLTIPVYYRSDTCEWPWVRFRKTGDRYDVDFSILDKYLPLYARICGAPKVLLVYAWDSGKCAPARYGRNKGRRKMEAEIVLTDATGALTPHRVPIPGMPGSEAVFRPLFEGIRRRVRRMGWDEKCIIIGWATDQRPSEDQLAMFKNVAPYARWAIITHGRGDGGPDFRTGAQKLTEDRRLLLDGMEIGHYVHPEIPRALFKGLYTWTISRTGIKPEPAGERPKGIAGGWNVVPPRYTNLRVYMYHTAGLVQYRCFPRGAMCSSGTTSAKGMSLIPLDFWPDEKGTHLLGRYGRSWVGGFFRNNTYWLVAPGPGGPIGTARYEMLREGFQETEARVAIEKALVGGRIGGELAESCRTFLEERLVFLWKGGKFARSNAQWQRGGMHDYEVRPDWQDRTSQLFRLAAEVARATGTRQARGAARHHAP